MEAFLRPFGKNISAELVRRRVKTIHRVLMSPTTPGDCISFMPRSASGRLGLADVQRRKLDAAQRFSVRPEPAVLLAAFSGAHGAHSQIVACDACV